MDASMASLPIKKGGVREASGRGGAGAESGHLAGRRSRVIGRGRLRERGRAGGNLARGYRALLGVREVTRSKLPSDSQATIRIEAKRSSKGDAGRQSLHGSQAQILHGRAREMAAA